MSAGVAVVLVVSVGFDSSVSGCLIDVVALAVLRAGGRLAHHLCPTVTVEVVDHELCVVCTVANILAEVNAPQQFAVLVFVQVQPVAVDVRIARVAQTVGVVLSVCRLPLQKEFVLAITVDIAHRHVVRIVGIRCL